MLKKILIFILLSLGFCSLSFADIEKVQTLLITGDFSAAEKECQAILSGSFAKPIKERARFYLATIELKQGDFSPARSNFNLLIHDFPESKSLNRARLGIADSYLFVGNYSLAEKIYTELLAMKDTQVASTVYARLIDLNLKQENRQAAQDYLNKLQQEYPLGLEAGLIKSLPNEIKKDVPAEDISSLPEEASTDFYTVQVGAFADKSKADKLYQELTHRGEDAYIVLLGTPSGPSLYRVRVGRLSSAREAEALAEKLSSQGYPTKIFP